MMDGESTLDFDYHLTESERRKVERMVPLHQAKIHLAFRADVTVNQKKYKQGAVALSEHLIVLAKKSFMGKGFTFLRKIHLFDLEAFSTASATYCKILIRNEPNVAMIEISADCCLRFARVLIRNYFVITKLFPPEMRFQFRPHDPNEFPPFDPHMSPSQIFQFCYNANCSYFEATYEHDVAQFFHSMVVSGNGIADLTRLPFRILELNYGRPLDLQSLFATMMFTPNVYGVVCYDVARPEIVYNIAPLVRGNDSLSLVDLHNCRAEFGVSELAEAVRKNSNSQIVYWDLSDNKFDDLSLFCAALSGTSSKVFYLNLSRSGLTADCTKLLFQALRRNKHLWDIRYLYIAGAKMTEEACQLFDRHIEKLAESKRMSLKTLDISNVGYFDNLLETLHQYQPPLEALYIGGAVFKLGHIVHISAFIAQSENLKVLGLAGAQLSVEQLNEIITSVNENSQLSDFSLDLSRLKLNGKRLAAVIDHLRGTNTTKWGSFSFDQNDMTTADLLDLIELLKSMERFHSLSIGGNFNRKDPALPEALAELSTLPNLQKLTIIGHKKSYLGEALIPLLKTLSSHETLFVLDISKNQIGNAGLDVICQVLETNRVLTEIRLDGSRVTDLNQFSRLLEILGSPENTKIQVCPFPATDFYQLMQNEKQQRRQQFKSFTQLQKRAQEKMQLNEAETGVHSDLSKKNMIELDELLDNITLAVYQLFEGVPLTEHAGLAGAFGLPFPHQDSLDQEASEAATTDENPYGVTNQHVTEDVVVPVDGLATLQWNSLYIRRPSARSQLTRSISSNLPPPSDIKQTPSKDKLGNSNSDSSDD